MPKAKGYSLWLMPEKEEYEELSRLISRFSSKMREDYFEPHVTLLGNIECSEDDVVERTRNLVSIIPRPIQLEITGISSGKEYFQRLFFNTNKPIELATAHDEARKAFSRKESFAYNPHISLVYSHSVVPQSVMEIASTSPLKKVNVKKLALVDANGYPREWCKKEEFPLK